MIVDDNEHVGRTRQLGASQTFRVITSLPTLELAIVQKIAMLGLHWDEAASLVLLLDVPSGFALQQLSALAAHTNQVIVVTENPCPEYWEDLWELGPCGLVVGATFDQLLVDTVAAVARGERCRVVPPAISPLTAAERTLLRQVAYGWDNRQIAVQLHVQEKTVRNTLTHIYAKLHLANRVQAALYYWGRADLCV